MTVTNLLLAVVAAWLTVGCASTTLTVTTSEMQPVMLKAPLLLEVKSSHDRTEYMRFTAATGNAYGKVKWNVGELWIISENANEPKKSWPFATISQLQGVAVSAIGRDNVQMYILTNEESKQGKKSLTRYSNIRLLVCEVGVNPADDSTACMRPITFSGTGFFDWWGDTKKGRIREYSASKLLSLAKSPVGQGLNEYLSSIPPSEYEAKLTQANADVRKQHEDKIAEAKRAEAASQARDAYYVKNLKMAKVGTQDSCTTGRVVVAATEPVSALYFECSLVGYVAVSTLNHNGWRIDNVERIPTSAVDGFQGVVVSVMISKIRANK